jgi:hypothetical protein
MINLSLFWLIKSLSWLLDSLYLLPVEISLFSGRYKPGISLSPLLDEFSLSSGLLILSLLLDEFSLSCG